MSENIKLYDLPVHGDSQAVFEEIEHVAAMAAGVGDFSDARMIHEDVVALFEGRLPGYRACNTKYHNLEHTDSVALAAMRIMHGLSVRGRAFTFRDAFLTISAAFMHDVGLIQTTDDREGTGAKHTIGHEERSVAFAARYFSGRGWPAGDVEDCADLIRCTNLQISPSSLTFSSDKILLLGQVVASADLLAQMADRTYLEKLLLLYKEFEEAGLPGFESELDLLQKTGDFYENVALARLKDDLGGAGYAARDHFRVRWNIDRNLYMDAVENNISYLRQVLNECRDEQVCLLEHFKRGGIVLDALNGE